MFLVQKTEGGKSTTPQTNGCITNGYILTLASTLPLAADQVSKFDYMMLLYDSVLAYQLDLIKGNDDKPSLSTMILNIELEINAFIFIVCSPETVIKPPRKDIIKVLIIIPLK